MKMADDLQFMLEALKQAEEAAASGEVPVGAVIVKDGRILAADRNRREELNDATAHAEILLLRQAGSLLGGWRLSGCTLYVTLEPCPMCTGALVLARLRRLVFGTPDPKAGAVVSLYDIARDRRLNHRLKVSGGVMQEQCSALLRDFFRQKRDGLT